MWVFNKFKSTSARKFAQEIIKFIKRENQILSLWLINSIDFFSRNLRPEILFDDVINDVIIYYQSKENFKLFRFLLNHSHHEKKTKLNNQTTSNIHEASELQIWK